MTIPFALVLSLLPLLAPVVSATCAYSDPCSQYAATCASCVANANCGWCQGQCYYTVTGTTAFNPSAPTVCTSGSNFQRTCSDSCYTTSTLGTTCSICTGYSACGWCAGSCYTAASSTATTTNGPAACQAGTGFAYSSGSCDSCNSYTTCATCTSHSTCGWCAVTGQCFSGSASGNTNGQAPQLTVSNIQQSILGVGDIG